MMKVVKLLVTIKILFPKVYLPLCLDYIHIKLCNFEMSSSLKLFILDFTRC